MGCEPARRRCPLASITARKQTGGNPPRAAIPLPTHVRRWANAARYPEADLLTSRCFDRRSLAVASWSPARYRYDVGKGRLGLVSPSPFGNESSGLWLRAADPHDERRTPARPAFVRVGLGFGKRSGRTLTSEPRHARLNDALRYDHCRRRSRRPVPRLRVVPGWLLRAGPRTGARSVLARPVRAARPLGPDDRELRPSRSAR